MRKLAAMTLDTLSLIYNLMIYFNYFHWAIMNEIWAGHLNQRSGPSVCSHFYFMTSNPSCMEQTLVADCSIYFLVLLKRMLDTFQKSRNPLWSPKLQETHWKVSFAVAGESPILFYPHFSFRSYSFYPHRPLSLSLICLP